MTAADCKIGNIYSMGRKDVGQAIGIELRIGNKQIRVAVSIEDARELQGALEKFIGNPGRIPKTCMN